MFNIFVAIWLLLSGHDPIVKEHVGYSGKEGISAKGYSVKMPIDPPECLQPLDRLTLKPFPPLPPSPPINPPPVTDVNPKKYEYNR